MKFEFKISKDVFLLFSALNAIGYNDENNPKGMCPARKKVRSILLKYNLRGKYPLPKKNINKYHQHNLLKLLLTKPKNANLILSLRKFSKEVPIQKAWKIFKDYQTKKTKNLFHLFKDEADRLIKFLNKPPQTTKKIILIPNFLDAYWRGYAFIIRKVGYVIVGPGADKNNSELIRHELLHILAPNFNLSPEITKKTHSLASMGYGDRKIINKEYIIRGLNLLYKSQYCKKSITKILKNEQKYFPKIKNAIEIIERKLKMAAN